MENKLLGFGSSVSQNKEGPNTEWSSNTMELPGINEILTRFISQNNPNSDLDPKARVANDIASTGFSWGKILDGYIKTSAEPEVESQTQRTGGFETESVRKFSMDTEKRDLGAVRKSSGTFSVLPSNTKSMAPKDQSEFRVGSRSTIEDFYLSRNVQEGMINLGFQTDPKRPNYLLSSEQEAPPTKAPKNEVFKFKKFEDFVKEMARPLKQQDVKSKLSELKDLVSSLKEIKKDDSNEKFEEVLNQLLSKPPQSTDYQPLYKIVAGFGPEYLRKFNRDHPKANQQKKLVINNPNLIVDQAKGTYLGHTEADEFDTYLKKKNEQKPEKSVDHSSAQTIVSKKESLSHPSEINIQPELTSLQYFLTQNLKETLELKELLRQKALTKPQENNSGGISDMLTSIKKVQTKAETLGIPDQSNLINNSAFGTLSRVLGKSMIKEDLYSNERRLHEVQTDRLIAKINSLNKQIEELQKDKFDSKRFVKSLPFTLKVGHVRVSRLLTDSLENFKLENYDSKYGFTDRFLAIRQNTLVFQNEQDVNDTLEIPFSDIEEIIRIECNSAYGFAIKHVERSHEESKSRSKSKKKRENKRNMGGLSKFHLVTLEDGKDFLLWDGAFFVVNTRIMLGNSRIHLNDVEFLSALQEFTLPHLQESHHIERDISESLKVDSITSTPKSVKDLERAPSLKNFPQRRSKNYNGPVLGGIEEEEGRLSDQRSEIKISPVKPVSYEPPNSIPNTGRVRTPDRTSDMSSSSGLIANLDALKNEILTQTKRQSLQTSKRKKGESPEVMYQRAVKHLQNGEVFLKYGTWGKPHEKIVKLSEDCQRIEWFSIDSGKKSDDMIEVSTIFKIEEGIDSQCFRKMKKNQEILANNPERVNLFFSILSEKRSLDLESGDEKRKTMFLQALTLILNSSRKSLTVDRSND